MCHRIFRVGNTKCNKNREYPRLYLPYATWIFMQDAFIKYDWYSSRVECRVGSIYSWTMHPGLVNRVAAIKETIKNSVECAFHISWWVFTWLGYEWFITYYFFLENSIALIYIYICVAPGTTVLYSLEIMNQCYLENICRRHFWEKPFVMIPGTSVTLYKTTSWVPWIL